MILSGKNLSDRIKAGLAEKVRGYADAYGRRPCLAVILVGEDPGSLIYVRNKERACTEVGIRNITLRFPEDVEQSVLSEEISRLNSDGGVDGILVQLPLPAHIDKNVIISAIRKDKDVDGFHPLNVAALWQKAPCMLPCTPKGIMRLLEEAGVDPKGKRAVVIGRSNIVGLPVSKLLLDANATVTICHTRTADLPSVTRQADIIICAAGRAGLLTGDMVPEGAVVIDVGMNRNAEGKLCGDVDFESVSRKASYVTPVPGGVGPMTIACLMENTVEAFLRHVG